MRTAIAATVLAFLVFASGSGLAAESREWEMLGRREVDFKRDRDRIDVGKNEGRFRELQIRVKNAPIEIYDMVVTFQNDETFRPKIRHRFEEGSGVRSINLPGDRRTIKRIDFRYKSIDRREGKGVVEVRAR